jgi:hypothetical protein
LNLLVNYCILCPDAHKTLDVYGYRGFPAQFQIDVTSLGNQRDQAQTDLTALEGSAVAAAPANQALGVKLGIGAAIGAAIGAGLLVYGIKEGSCD